MLDFADIVAINKFDKRGAQDAIRDVRKQFQRNHKAFDKTTDAMPVYGTIASQFNDPGTNLLYQKLIELISTKTQVSLKSNLNLATGESEKYSSSHLEEPATSVKFQTTIVNMMNGLTSKHKSHMNGKL